jgi:hypothetical protein
MTSWCPYLVRDHSSESQKLLQHQARKYCPQRDRKKVPDLTCISSRFKCTRFQQRKVREEIRRPGLCSLLDTLPVHLSLPEIIPAKR